MLTRYINRGMSPIMFEGVGLVQPGQTFNYDRRDLVDGFNHEFPGSIEEAPEEQPQDANTEENDEH